MPLFASITDSAESALLIQMVAECQRIALIWQSVSRVHALVHVAFRFSDGSRRSCRHSSCSAHYWSSDRCIAGFCAEKQRSGLTLSSSLFRCTKSGGLTPRIVRSIWLKFNTRHRSLPGSEGRDLPWLFGWSSAVRTSPRDNKVGMDLLCSAVACVSDQCELDGRRHEPSAGVPDRWPAF